MGCLVTAPIVATKGDSYAMKVVMQHFNGYIASLSIRKLYDDRGNAYYCVDGNIRERLQAELMKSVPAFKTE